MQPLAERMRPSKLEDYIGQDHLVGENSPLRKALEAGHLPSCILWDDRWSKASRLHSELNGASIARASICW
jgi:hypothetical protein